MEKAHLDPYYAHYVHTPSNMGPPTPIQAHDPTLPLLNNPTLPLLIVMLMNFTPTQMECTAYKIIAVDK